MLNKNKIITKKKYLKNSLENKIDKKLFYINLILLFFIIFFLVVFLILFLTSYFLTNNSFIDNLDKEIKSFNDNSKILNELKHIINTGISDNEELVMFFIIQILSLIFAFLTFLFTIILLCINYVYYKKDKQIVRRIFHLLKFQILISISIIFLKINNITNKILKIFKLKNQKRKRK